MAASTTARCSGIPIVDLAPLESDSPRELEETAARLYDAFKNVGFAYVKNHGVPQDVVDEAFAWSRKFFALPQSVKDKAPHPPYGWHHRGYSGVGVEKTTQMMFDDEDISESRKVPDCKESFEIGSDENARMPNIWPPEHEVPGFREFFGRFYDACYGVEVKLLKAIAVGMGLDEGYFLDYHSKTNNQIRLLHYPPVDASLLGEGKVECIGAHTDFGTMTLLFQDEVGGLEVEDISDKGRFNPAPYMDGTVVVNIGDLLMRWSNDELKSTLHRVRTPADQGRALGQRMTRARYSIPYFVCADGDRTIDCVPGCFGPGRPKKYAPINCDEYVDMRMNALY
ncbi:2OG-Fe(II) oxygenase superfamily protein [Hirsutella rhossiliensis]|uniref:2OG-Fe(II) oxygenase superfamily domain-containing protein n=1 Tax=Hirsutella rhossiliensis TaxID=111463 RepID=A0A9P8N9K0_9HYPO|nr:2OG-Fe(II) oxygenase superfamily domain-containing protein [Hirsutella rhossiliensis]KAH0968501.1 2OG-Fe(II) oxygenase superfamily domain-containing protein [Hirsutella rhossiliensis]